MALLADRLMEMKVVASIDLATVWRKLKNDLKPWFRQQRDITPKQCAPFVAAREDVPGVYARPPDPARPVVYVDEGGKQTL